MMRDSYANGGTPRPLQRPPAGLVAVVTPMSTRATLSADEEISMRHLRHYLGRYDRYLVAPEGLELDFPDFRIQRFHPKFFGSLRAHSWLILLPAFYKAFARYKYILIYHLDALAFSDQLEQWCATDIDYIGAPWMPCPDLPWIKEPAVGNGGFALMKVESCLKVLYGRYRRHPTKIFRDFLARNADQFHALKWVQRTFYRLPAVQRADRIWDAVQRTEVNTMNNDQFWSFEAMKYYPQFRVASVEMGLRFAFETIPARCFELAGRQLPFGCHAFAKYDRAFWEPHILKTDVAATVQT
jgi:hypothetical protein